MPRTLWPNLLGAGLPYRAGVLATGVPMEGLPTSCGFLEEILDATKIAVELS